MLVSRLKILFGLALLATTSSVFADTLAITDAWIKKSTSGNANACWLYDH